MKRIIIKNFKTIISCKICLVCETFYGNHRNETSLQQLLQEYTSKTTRRATHAHYNAYLTSFNILYIQKYENMNNCQC